MTRLVKTRVSCFVVIHFCITSLFAQKPVLSFTVSIKDTAMHLFHVTFRCEGLRKDTVTFKMPAWTTGYYQLMNYADNVQNFNASNISGHELKWNKASANSWQVESKKNGAIILSYDIATTWPFVAA